MCVCVGGGGVLTLELGRGVRLEIFKLAYKVKRQTKSLIAGVKMERACQNCGKFNGCLKYQFSM